MKIPKEKFENKVDELLKKFSGKNLDALLKDFSDCLIFACVYGGKNDVDFETVKLKTSKQDEISVQQYTLNSYDNVYTLKLSYAENYFKFKKIDDCENYLYTSEYFLDFAGNYTRKSYLKNQQLGKKQEISEVLEGTTKDGAYLVNTTENFSKLEICCFKLPNFEKSGENVYIKYKTLNDEPFMCKSKSKLSKIPFLENLGMNGLSNLLSSQFDGDEPLRIDDEMFFNKLLSSAKELYKLKKKKASK
ncbi:MAG: hypothetical protein J5779_01390 [Clostridia bacterium]|nr:hypothetical protein [Clostridia bacterium]